MEVQVPVIPLELSLPVIPLEPEQMPMDLDGEHHLAEVKHGVKPIEFPPLVIHRLCEYASIQDLKIFRLVSRKWNYVVSSHNNYFNNMAKFSTAWGKAAEIMDFNALTKWSSIKLRYFNYFRQPIFPKYWVQIVDSVSTMHLEYLRIHCHELANLINSCVGLTTLRLKGVKVEPIYEITEKEAVQQGDNANNEFTNVTYITHCDHKTVPFGNGNENDKYFNPVFGPATITTLEIVKQCPLPICVLSILQERTRQVLVNFKLEGCPENLRTRVMTPGHNTSMEYIRNILETNQNTLRTFSFLQNEAGIELLQGILQPAFARLGLTEISMHQVPHATDHLTSPAFPTICNILARHQQLLPHLETLSLEAYMSQHYIRRLQQVLVPIATLRKLRLGFLLHAAAAPLNFAPLYQNLVQLVDFTIEDLQYTRMFLRISQASMWRFERRVGTAYFPIIPPALKSLTISHHWERQDQNNHRAQFFQNQSIAQITKLELFNCKVFDDHLMALLMENMTNLEELAITNSTKLSDAGVTGLDEQTCRILSNSSELIEIGAIQDRLRICLANRWKLRILNLSGCCKLSDVSIRFAFAFPHLTSLDLSGCQKVTDSGLIWLGENNPKLETLTARHVLKLSHFGLTNLIRISKTIRKVYVSEDCKDTRNPFLTYDEHPLYNEIVDGRTVKTENPHPLFNTT